jgi:tetratricopeptide (TPR) repeat protein
VELLAGLSLAKLCACGVLKLLKEDGPAVDDVPAEQLIDAAHSLTSGWLSRRDPLAAFCHDLARDLVPLAERELQGGRAAVPAVLLNAEAVLARAGLSRAELVRCSEAGTEEAAAARAADQVIARALRTIALQETEEPCRRLVALFYGRLLGSVERFDALKAAYWAHLLAGQAEQTGLLRLILSRLERPEEVPPLPKPLPAPRPLVGRAAEVDALAAMLLDDADRRPVLVRGGPGIGKTALTIAALHAPGVAARFGGRRCFVELDAVRVGEAVLDAVGEVLGEAEGRDRAARALRRLGAEPSALLVLDNLETPWETEGQGPATAEALRRLAAVPGLSLLASIRGSERPAGVRWRGPPEVEPLAPADARRLFLDIAGEEHAADPALDALLAVLGGVPLAVELMAWRVEDDDVEDLGRLLALWRERRTRLAAVGAADERELSLHASIGASLTSPRLTDAGRRLFALMGRLPDGIAEEDADALLGGGGFEATSGLRRVGLARREAGRLRMLAPVREHAGGEELSPTEGERFEAFVLEAVELLQGPAGDGLSLQRARAELSNLEAALGTFLGIASSRVVAKDVSAAAALRQLAVARARVADARQITGNLPLALEGYTVSKKILTRVAASDPDNMGRQRDLSVCWNRIGDMRMDQGDLAGALAAYENGLRIRERLAVSDPDNTKWQIDLSVSWGRLGRVKQATGDLAGALRAYEDGLTIAERLAVSDPENPESQRCLSTRLCDIGDVKLFQKDLAGALRAYERDLAIAKRLAGENSGNVDLQRDLSASWSRIGTVHMEMNNLVASLHAYEICQSICHSLIEGDPANMMWQRDLLMSLSNIGTVKLKQNDVVAAREAYEGSCQIAERLVAANLENAAWHHDLSKTWIDMGDVRRAQGDLIGALEAYKNSVRIAEQLTAADPGNADWQSTLVRSCWHVADLLERLPERRSEAKQFWEAALQTAKALRDSGRLAPRRAYFIDGLERRLAGFERRR